MNKFSTAMTAVAIIATSAMAGELTNERMAAALKQIIVLHRAEVICSQYKFHALGGMDYEKVVALARRMLGDAAVDAQIDEENVKIGDAIEKGQKSFFCDQVENYDAEMGSYGKHE